MQNKKTTLNCSAGFHINQLEILLSKLSDGVYKYNIQSQLRVTLKFLSTLSHDKVLFREIRSNFKIKEKQAYPQALPTK